MSDNREVFDYMTPASGAESSSDESNENYTKPKLVGPDSEATCTSDTPFNESLDASFISASPRLIERVECFRVGNNLNDYRVNPNTIEQVTLSDENDNNNFSMQDTRLSMNLIGPTEQNTRPLIRNEPFRVENYLRNYQVHSHIIDRVPVNRNYANKIPVKNSKASLNVTKTFDKETKPPTRFEPFRFDSKFSSHRFSPNAYGRFVPINRVNINKMPEKDSKASVIQSKAHVQDIKAPVQDMKASVEDTKPCNMNTEIPLKDIRSLASDAETDQHLRRRIVPTTDKTQSSDCTSPVLITSNNEGDTNSKSKFAVFVEKLDSDDVSSGDVKYFITRHKLHWYWAPAFIAFWMLLYTCISIPAYHRLPTPLFIKDETRNPDRFIAERAQINLKKLTDLGPRVVGSSANEKDAITYFMNAMESLKANAKDKWDLEANVQEASGSYIHWQMVNMYQSVQNFVIKISEKNSTSNSFLLVNSHYDSVPGGLGANDDGAMVAIMLETLRVLSQSDKPLKHPVVFLFNGAEENPLQASHAFITQHKWAKNVKALINLDSAGSGGREILFQSGPNHPWLMKYYRRAIKHPYASTVAEEMFQRHFIPSDTDFRIFRDHGRVPGLDMAHQYNGYVYHTIYDTPEIIPLGTYQNTGDNVLSLVRAIANAPEMEDTSKHAEGNTIFYDVMGFFLVFYSETEGIILNIVVALAAIAAVTASFYMMAAYSGVELPNIIKRTMYLFGVEITATFAAITLCFFFGFLMDLMKMPMSWFTHSWLIFGLYFCPLFFGLAIVPAIYLTKTSQDRLPIGYRVQLLLHCHCLFLAFMTLVLTICSIRSAFMFMLTLLFYSMGLIINLATKLHNRPLLWLVPHIICGIPPFLFYAYVCHGFFVTFIPMTGRFGAGVNPDLIICAFTVGVGLLTGGFMIPVLNLFKKSKVIISSLLVITAICIIIAATPLGFPYRPDTSVQRFSVLHTRRVFHDAKNAVRRQESGYFLMPSDRRTYSVKKHALNMSLAQSITADCKNEMLCGLPLYNHRWHKSRASSLWIPGPDPKFDKLPEVKVISKKEVDSCDCVCYDLELKGPDHMALFIRPLKDSKITAWSFHHTPLRMEWKPPYFVYFSYGKDPAPLKFWLQFEKTASFNLTDEFFEIGISGHWNHHDHLLTNEVKQFIDSFPKYAHVTAWPASYETWVF